MSVVTIGDGEITIAADLLAPKLGLSVEALKAEMRRGCVYSVTEQGIDDDLGRARLTFRYRNRSWTVVVEPDGTLVETRHQQISRRQHKRWSESVGSCEEGVMAFMAEDLAATTNVDGKTRQTIAPRLLAHLQKIAEQRVPITYQELAKALELVPPNAIHQVTEALEHLMAEDAATDRPFIAAIAISKARGGLPAPGFFDCARRLGRFAGDGEGPEAWAFHAGEFNAAVSLWAATATTGKAGKDAWTFIRRKPRPRPN